MNSFIENVNYVANLDNKYGSRVEIYKNNLSLRTELHDIVFTLEYYNFSDKKLHTLEYLYSDISIDNFNSTLLNLKSQVELTGLFDCVVSFSYTNFVINNVANIDIKITSNSDNIKTYGFNLNITKDLTEIYNINGIVSDTLKILPVVASLDSSFIDAVTTIQENIDVIKNAEANVIIASEKAVEALSSSNIAIENATISINNASVAILSANNSEISAELALTSANTATTKASEASLSSYSAANSANIATLKANEASASSSSANASSISANNAAVSVSSNATIAENSATIASTKATEAIANASSALTSATNALDSSNSASLSATTATQQADIATVKSTEASASASSALISKNESATNSSNSLVNANNASISEANALAYKNSALSSKNSSAVSETNALSYSNLAHASELSSQSSATSAASSAINASNSEVASASSATLSSAKATESFNSANDALTSKNKAEKWAIELEDVQVEPGKYSAMHWALKAEELASGSAGSASSVSYDNSTSGLVANDVQSAIDEIDINIETLSSNVYTKTDINNSLALKVDKIAEKGLSTEDYTTIEKTKLFGIASGAQVNVPTDLSLGTVTATVISLNSSTGTDVNLPSATTSTAGLLSATDKTKLDDIADNANNYTLPVATSTVKGGVELYSDTVQTVDSNAVSTTANRTYGIQLNSAGQVVVNVPWSDTNTIYEHPITDGSLHVPATGTTNNGKVLMAGATAGSVSWQTIPSGVTDHTLLTNIGTNTHAQIDTALTRLVNTSGTNTGDQTITLTGDVTGSGTGSFSTTLKNTGTAGTYKSVTTDSQGRVTSGTNPTTIAGFGITDVYTKTEVDIMYGDIASALDTINGEVI